MGFFSGIFDGIKDVVGAVAPAVGGFFGGPAGAGIGSAISGIAGLAGDVGGAISPFLQSNSVNSANMANIELARQQREWQAQQNQAGMNFSHDEAVKNRHFQHSLFNYANDFNREENRIARQWSENMANTSYQRATKDMMAAGLNPMLAYSQGGASTPPSSGATSASPPSGSSPSGLTSSSAAATVRPTFSAQSFVSAAQAAQLGAQVKNTMADTANKEATADQIRAETRLIRLQGDTEGYRPGEVSARSGLMSAQEKESRDLLLDKADKLRAEAQHSRSSASQIESQRVLMKELMANPWTRDWAPYILDGLKGR